MATNSLVLDDAEVVQKDRERLRTELDTERENLRGKASDAATFKTNLEAA